MEVYSQLVRAQLENKNGDYASGRGMFWFNTSTSLFKFYDGSAVRSIVTTDNTQTLTNKSLNDTTTTFQNTSDTTKKFQFLASEITAGQTRIYTVPDADATLAGLATTQTFSNKSFSDAITGDEISTPSNPAASKRKLYFKSDGLYQLTSGGTETKFSTTTSAVPTIQRFTANPTGATNYSFVISSGSATIGATYTNNGQTFTVLATISSATLIFCSGTGTPASSGTLTRASGSGDATLTFSSFAGAYITPAGVSYARIKLVGAGGGGSGSGVVSSMGAGGTGGNTTFGTSLLTANGGAGGAVNAVGGSGGAATVNSPATSIVEISGGYGQGVGKSDAGANTNLGGGQGGASFYGGTGGGGGVADNARPGVTNTGGGGGGAVVTCGVDRYAGAGGGAGAYIEALISAPSGIYAYAVGAAGTGGTAGTGGNAGGAGGSGMVIVEEFYI